MSEGIMKEGILPVRFVAADPIYGESDDFLRAAEAHVGVTYSVQITSDTLCRLGPPVTGTGTYRYRKENCLKRAVLKGEKSPARADISAKGIRDVLRYRRTVSGSGFF